VYTLHGSALFLQQKEQELNLALEGTRLLSLSFLDLMNQPNHHVVKSTQIEASLPDRPVSDLQPTSMDDFDMLGQVGEGTYG